MAPPARGGLARLSAHNASHLVNWTMTYHESSDIVAYYGYFRSLNASVQYAWDMSCHWRDSPRPLGQFCLGLDCSRSQTVRHGHTHSITLGFRLTHLSRYPGHSSHAHLKQKQFRTSASATAAISSPSEPWRAGVAGSSRRAELPSRASPHPGLGRAAPAGSCHVPQRHARHVVPPGAQAKDNVRDGQGHGHPTPGSPYHNPLPDIGRTAVWETEEETEEDADEGVKEEDENPLHSVDSPPPPTYEETQQVSRWVEEINAQNLLFSRDGGSDGADASRQSAPTSGKRRTPTLNPEGIETQFTDLTSSGLEKRPATAASKGEGQSQEDDEVLKNEVKVRIQELVEQLKSDDPSVKLEAMVESRKLLSQEVDPPVQDFIDSGVLPLAIAAVKAENSELQYEATWVITNIASGTSEQTTAVVDHGAVPVLIELLGSPEVRLQEQAAWALGNISADSPGLRDQLVADGIVTPLMSSIKEDMPISFRRNLSWVLSNIFRYKGIDMPEEEKLLVLGELKHNLEKQDDFEVKSNSIWTLNYFMEQSDSHIQLVVEQGFVPLLVENIPDTQLQKVTVRCLGNILTGNDSQTEQVLEAGVLPLYLDILASSHSESVRKEVLWSLSNVTAGTATQVQRVVDAGLLPVLVDSVMQGSLAERKEACWALSNLTSAGSTDHVKALVEADALPAFTKMLISTDVRLVEVTLDGLGNTLRILSESDEGAEGAIQIIRAADGVDVLESLLKYASSAVVSRADHILNTYFPNSEEVSSPDDALMEDLRMIFGEPTDAGGAEAAHDLPEQASKYTTVPLEQLGEEDEEEPEGDGASASV